MAPGAVEATHETPDPVPATRGAERGSIVVLSGPEGGLTEGEEGLAVANGFRRVSLGPRVLRADTAPLAFLAWLAIAARS